MPDFERGVSWYTEAQATIYFPEGHVCCDLCPLKFIEKQEENEND